MTTAAVPSPGSASAASHASSTFDTRATFSGGNSFDRQLDAAKQQHAPDADSSSSGARAAAPARPSPAQPSKAAAATAASTQSAAESKPASGTRGDKADSPAKPAHSLVDDAAAVAGAATLAGAMLALLPTAAAALKPAAGGALDGSVTAAKAGVGNGVGSALDSAAAALLPTGPAGNAAVAAPTDAAAISKELLSAAAAGLPNLELGKHAKTGLDQPTAMLAATLSGAAPLTPMLMMKAPLGSHAFQQELGQQVAWLGGQAGEGVKQASIRLHPQDLGQLDVKISMNQGKVDVVFNAQHPAAVTAVQQTLPQLGHLLAQHGLSLGHAEVGQQQNRSDRQDSRQGSASRSADIDDMQVQAVNMPVSISSVGLLDAFA